jgi:predicted aspartyl protease
VEALIDTGGARCMIDIETANKLGLEVEVATKEKNWGSYFGPGE